MVVLSLKSFSLCTFELSLRYEKEVEKKTEVENDFVINKKVCELYHTCNLVTYMRFFSIPLMQMFWESIFIVTLLGLQAMLSQ